MATATQHDPRVSPQAAEMDALERRMAALTAEIRESRAPQAWGNAQKTVRRYGGSYAPDMHFVKAAGADVPFPNVFPSAGAFFKTVQRVGNATNANSDELMRKYVEQSGNWYGQYVRKMQAAGFMTKASPSGLNETVGADGAFLVPPQFVQQLLQRAYDNDLLSRTTLFPMTSNVLKIPAVNETSRADGSRFGGVQALWEGEAQSGTEKKPGFAQIQLNLSKLMLLVRATDELLEDSGIALETFIDSIASQELTFKIGDGIINGDGVSKPLGILNAPCLVKASAQTNQAAGTLVTENVVQMWSQMWIGSRPNAVWLINQELEPQLLTLNLGVGTGGVVTYMPPGGLSAAPYGTLLGRPVIVTEFNAAPGTVGDIILADLSTYLTGTKGGMQSAVSMHVYFESAEQVFRFIMRIDGRPWWLQALTKYKGSKTVSPFVALNAR